MKRTLLVLCFLAGLFGRPAPAAGEQASPAQTFYLSPSGSDSNPGTRQAPWKTLAKASQARAGQTIVLLPGTYPGILEPVNSGKPGAPITFRAEPRRAGTLVGAEDDRHIIQIAGHSHIRIEGLVIRPKWPQTGRWVAIADASHIAIRDCLMEDVAGGSGLGFEAFFIKQGDQIRVEDCILREFYGGNMVNVYKSEHILFAGNAIGRTGHSPLAFSPRIRFLKSVENLVIRGNVFFADWGRPFELFGAPNVLFENNVIINAYHGARSAGPEAKMMTENGIIRFNRVYRNWGAPINLGYYNPKAEAKNSRWYNNVIDHNPQWGIRLETVTNYLFKNNIFSRNGRFGSRRQIIFRGGAEKFRFLGNVFWSDGGAALLDDMRRSGSGLTLDDVQSARWRASHGDQFHGNMVVNPRFVDLENYNHSLKPSSPLRDAGLHLTHTTAAGHGTVIPVEDALYFYAGFGIAGEQGDVVAVGSAKQRGRILNVNRQAGTIRLARPVKWEKGDPVSLPWAKAGPDIGLYEYGDSGRVSVQIVTEPFAAVPGEPVHLRAILRGAADPVSFRWLLGDGTLAGGAEVTHRYDEVDGYGIRLQVTDAKGRTHRAAGFVDVQDPQRFQEPLLFTSFDSDPEVEPDFSTPGGKWFRCQDGNWYQVYYRSRPTTALEIEFDSEGNGTGHFTATFDDHPLEVTAYPAGWLIDKWPIVTLRYRIDPGVPLGISVQAFGEIGREQKVFVAAVAGADLPARERLPSPEILKNDGRWHEVRIDVRSIRKRYLAVKALQFLRFEATDPQQVEEGAGYWLDDVTIRPEMNRRENPRLSESTSR